MCIYYLLEKIKIKLILAQKKKEKKRDDSDSVKLFEKLKKKPMWEGPKAAELGSPGEVSGCVCVCVGVWCGSYWAGGYRFISVYFKLCTEG